MSGLILMMVVMLAGLLNNLGWIFLKAIPWIGWFLAGYIIVAVTILYFVGLVLGGF